MTYVNLKTLGLKLICGSIFALGSCATSDRGPDDKQSNSPATVNYMSSADVRGGESSNWLSVSDTDAQPIIRIPPIFPLSADKSGHCLVRFNVSPQGSTYDVKTISCSDQIFARSTVKSVRQWKYKVKIIEGQMVGRRNVETKVVFQLRDDNGKVIPE